MKRADSGTDLEATRRALASWRREYGGPGRRIPAQFWEQAQELARVHGVTQTARTLRLDEGRLAAMADEAPVSNGPSSVEAGAFVELEGVEVSVRADAAVVELLGREGDCIRVQVASSELDLVGLATAFWSRRS
jgi:hypothetical protein